MDKRHTSKGNNMKYCDIFMTLFTSLVNQTLKT